ncbi:hypothetical protein CDAR_593511 [Caerostris darwini]|uniref:Uncharacterized protein n=1 Tax=Caerostris darwini TaxID=1538125 RepID=A0AAV4S3I6_9ARAC|nr:hypothetical protein CDAR_593511 [Caerostris darwini]
MCTHDKFHIRNPAIGCTTTAYYAALDIHHHHLPSQFVRQNSMDRSHTPVFDRRLLVDGPYEALIFPKGLERIEANWKSHRKLKIESRNNDSTL